MINVNWDDAKAYATWLSRKTGKTYRLLSEAEREYVTRAGTTTPFWWGSYITPQRANYNGSVEPYKGGGSNGEYRKSTVPVDSFEANPWGLYNVHGNVWEWTEDCWNDSNTGNPGNGSARETGDCSRHVLRGGSWYYIPRHLRAAYRDWSTTDGRSGSYGFRLARTISAELNQGQVKEATEAWAALKDTTSIPALEAYIARFPDSLYADLARTRIAELKRREMGSQRCGEITRSRDAYRDCIAEPNCAWNSNWQYCHQRVREASEAEHKADQERQTDAARPFIAVRPQSVYLGGYRLALEILLFRIAIEMARRDAQDGSDEAHASAAGSLKERVAIPEPPKPTLVRPAPLPQCDGVMINVGWGEHKCMKPGAGKTESFKDCPECPEMVVVPAGSFTWARRQANRNAP